MLLSSPERDEARWGNHTDGKFRKVDASVLEKPEKRPVGRQPSPEQLALIAKIKTITDPSIVYEVILDSDEKPITVRQQLLRASKAAGVPIVIRKAERGFLRRDGDARAQVASRSQAGGLTDRTAFVTEV